MKELIFLLFVTFSFSGTAHAMLIANPPDFSVISHTPSKAVGPGYFLFKGNVFSKETNEIKHASFLSQSQKSLAIDTDSSGSFEMILPVTDSVIYCFHLGYHEIVFNFKAKSQHILNVNFFMDRVNMSDYLPVHIIPQVFPPEVIMVDKPVIYAYNAPADVELSIPPKGSFSFTYPYTKNGTWKFKTQANGTLQELTSGKKYPYLFWEGYGKDLGFASTGSEMEGYLIKTDTCVSFFESILGQVGLNEKESADFITYWVPQVLQKEYALIRFLQDEAYTDVIAEIKIHPAPESLIRLYMLVMPLDTPETDFVIREPKMTSYARSGFTVVEWGGSVIPENRIAN